MKKMITSFAIGLTLLASSAHALEACEAGFKNLYIDIQIYKQTEAISAGDGLIGNRLQIELKFLRTQKMSLSEKIAALETGFARCDMQLSEQDDLDIQMAKDELLKAKNPYQSE